MNPVKCRATKRNGEKCNNWAMKNSLYCWSHSFGRVKGTPLLKSATFHALLALISIFLTVFIAIHSCSRTATRDNQLRMESKIDEILDAVRDYDEEHYAELIRKYPLGYVYIGYDLKNRRITTEDRTRQIQDFRIKWINSQVEELSEGRMSVIIPDFWYRHNFYQRNVIGFDREVGKSQKVPFGMPGVRMWFELLVDSPERLIWIIGLREEKTVP